MSRKTTPCSDDEPVGYDGFGAPIYAHQLEEDMPTDLPPDFKGTGKPKPAHWVEVDDEIRTKVEEETTPLWFLFTALVLLLLGGYTAVRLILAAVHAIVHLAS